MGEQLFLHTLHRPDLINMYTKYHQNISNGIRVIEGTSFPYKVHSREITQNASKEEHPFLHMTHRLDLIYIPTKYYQNISKGIKVIERTSFPL